MLGLSLLKPGLPSVQMYEMHVLVLISESFLDKSRASCVEQEGKEFPIPICLCIFD